MSSIVLAPNIAALDTAKRTVMNTAVTMPKAPTFSPADFAGVNEMKAVTMTRQTAESANITPQQLSSSSLNFL